MAVLTMVGKRNRTHRFFAGLHLGECPWHIMLDSWSWALRLHAWAALVHGSVAMVTV